MITCTSSWKQDKGSKTLYMHNNAILLPRPGALPTAAEVIAQLQSRTIAAQQQRGEDANAIFKL